MKILFTGLQYNYYDPARGVSFEFENFYRGMQTLPGVVVVPLFFERILGVGRKQFNQELLKMVEDEKPDIVFAFMFSDELQPKTLKKLKGLTTTIAWFSDDHWRFFNYSKRYARHFTWAVTTYSKAVEWYHRRGIKNVLRSQWGVWRQACSIPDAISLTARQHDVAFIGGWSSPRERIISGLRRRGIEVYVRGDGWPEGKVSYSEMLEVFATSKINLALNPAPGFLNSNSLGRIFFRRSMNRIVFDFHWFANLRSLMHRGIQQIKARHFEIPALRGFMVTSHADDLDQYFVPGKEIVVYENIDDLAEKVRYYLAHDAERRAIAQAGYDRVVRDHTYEKRFEDLFTQTAQLS